MKVICNAVACFANDGGQCVCLKDNDFGDKRCPFFKTKKMQAEQEAKCRKRLEEG